VLRKGFNKKSAIAVVRVRQEAQPVPCRAPDSLVCIWRPQVRQREQAQQQQGPWYFPGDCHFLHIKVP